MHFFDIIKSLAKESSIILFVDMDGVIASYDAGKPLDFLNKRPLTENINKLRLISTIPNVELHILSICRKDYQIEEKNIWLNEYASFFQKENRHIISKELLDEISSKEVKENFLKNFKTEKKMILLDDDNIVLNYVMKNVKDIIVFQDSELID